MLRKSLFVAAVAVTAFVLGATGMVGVAYATDCVIGIDYTNIGPVVKGTSGSQLPSVYHGNCVEIDDIRNYVKLSGPSWVSVNSFNGKVTYDTTGVNVGTYNVSVGVNWYCSCSNGYDADSFTISVC